MRLAPNYYLMISQPFFCVFWSSLTIWTFYFKSTLYSYFIQDCFNLSRIRNITKLHTFYGPRSSIDYVMQMSNYFHRVLFNVSKNQTKSNHNKLVIILVLSVYIFVYIVCRRVVMTTLRQQKHLRRVHYI